MKKQNESDAFLLNQSMDYDVPVAGGSNNHSEEPKIRRRDLNNYEYESSSEEGENDGGGLGDLFEHNPFGGFMKNKPKVESKGIPTNKI